MKSLYRKSTFRSTISHPSFILVSKVSTFTFIPFSKDVPVETSRRKEVLPRKDDPMITLPSWYILSFCTISYPYSPLPLTMTVVSLKTFYVVKNNRFDGIQLD